ncbi:MAG: FdtA/QdtA family cupin domain-containing protein [Patescibacteria group bacterium]
MNSGTLHLNDLLITLPVLTHKPGDLIIAEPRKICLNFFHSAPRVYWIINNTEQEVERGGHCHPQGGKREIMICLSGLANVELHCLQFCTHVTLDSPKQGLLVPNMLWHKVRLAPGAILLSIASTERSSDECIDKMPCNCPQ